MLSLHNLDHKKIVYKCSADWSTFRDTIEKCLKLALSVQFTQAFIINDYSIICYIVV